MIAITKTPLARFASFGLMLAFGASAAAQNFSSVSPDGEFVLKVSGDRDKARTEVFARFNRKGPSFSSEHAAVMQGLLEKRPTQIVWSPDSRAVALSFPSGKYLTQTWVLLAGEKEFRSLMVREEEDSQVIPLRWEDATTLVLEVCGPHGGKADDETAANFFRYTVRMKAKDGSFQELDRSKTEYPYSNR